MRIITASILYFVLSISSYVNAEPRQSSGGDIAHKMKLQMRQLMQQRDAEKAKTKKLENDIVKLKKDLEKQQEKTKKIKSKLNKTTKRGQALAERLQGSFDKLRDTYEKNRELQSNLNSTTAERDEFRGELHHCMNMNVKLYKAGVEVVQLYEKEASLKVEPVFQIKAVEIENTVQDYRFKMEDFTLQNKNRVEETPVSATSPSQ